MVCKSRQSLSPRREQEKRTGVTGCRGEGRDQPPPTTAPCFSFSPVPFSFFLIFLIFLIFHCCCCAGLFSIFRGLEPRLGQSGRRGKKETLRGLSSVKCAEGRGKKEENSARLTHIHTNTVITEHRNLIYTS